MICSFADARSMCGGGRSNLTLIGVIDRRVRLPLSKWRGYGVDFFSVRWRVGFPEQRFVLGWF